MKPDSVHLTSDSMTPESLTTDRELLESAAEAAGIDHLSVHADGLLYAHNQVCSERCQWNPLKDDGDAFRLAVNLDITLDFCADMVLAAYPCGGDEFDFVDEKYGSDKTAATRRAIVRAAAAIGALS